MLDIRYFQNDHLTDEAFAALNQGLFTPDESILILTHLDVCPQCLERWISSLDASPAEEPPDEMTSRILEAVAAEQQKKKKAKIIAIQFTKLAIAVGLTFVLGTSGVFDFLANLPERRAEAVPQLTLEQKIQAEKENQKSTFSFGSVVDAFNSGFNSFANNLDFGIRNIGDEQK